MSSKNGQKFALKIDQRVNNNCYNLRSRSINDKVKQTPKLNKEVKNIFGKPAFSKKTHHLCLKKEPIKISAKISIFAKKISQKLWNWKSRNRTSSNSN